MEWSMLKRVFLFKILSFIYKAIIIQFQHEKQPIQYPSVDCSSCCCLPLWAVQNATMLMTQSPFYVEFHNSDCSKISYWMTQHVFKGLKDEGKCQIFVALCIWNGITSEGNTRKSIKCKSCNFSSWLRDRTPRGGISIPSPTQKSKKWVWARPCPKSSPYKYREWATNGIHSSEKGNGILIGEWIQYYEPGLVPWLAFFMRRNMKVSMQNSFIVMHWSSEAAKYTNRNSKDIILQQKSSFCIDANFNYLFLGKNIIRFF